MWIGLFPELSAVGGIQQVSRHIGAVLARRSRERRLACELLALNDAAGPGSFAVGRDEYCYRGFGRSKTALLAYLLGRATRIDFLVLGHVNLAPLGLLLRLIRPRIQYWVVAHGVEVWTSLPAHRRRALARTRGVFSVSAFTADQLVEKQKLDRRDVFVLSPALDPSFILPAADDDRPPAARKVLLTVGRLVSSEPGKGVDTVIRVLPDVLKCFPDLLYIVVGEGDLKPRLEEWAQQSTARSHIQFIGHLQLGDLKKYYSACDIYVMPSRQEGFGLVFLEAMAFGKPVIAGKCGGAAEIVRDGQTGFLVDPDNSDELAERLIRLLQDDALRKKMGARGRQLANDTYSFARFEQKLTRILDTATCAALRNCVRD